MNVPTASQLVTVRHGLGTGALNVFGPPGSGKGTLCKSMAAQLGAAIIDGGEHFRRWADSLAPDVREMMDRGELLPSKIYLEAITQELFKQAYAGMPLLLGSVGRFIGEEQEILRACRVSGHQISLALHIRVPYRVALERCIHRNMTSDLVVRRVDDSVEKFPKRWKEYLDKTLPVIEAYRRLGLLVEVDGTQSIEEVAGEAWGLAATYFNALVRATQ